MMTLIEVALLGRLLLNAVILLRSDHVAYFYYLLGSDSTLQEIIIALDFWKPLISLLDLQLLLEGDVVLIL